jgi:hypothetical protein
MGCSAITIEGGSGDEMGSFPALFVANLDIEGGKCPTTASQDVLYPNPGQYVTTMSATNGKNWPKATPTGDGCAGGSAAQPTGYGSGSGSGSGSSAPAPSSSAYAQPTGYGAPGGYGAPSQAAPTSVASHISSAIASYDNQKGRETQTAFGSQAQTTFATSASVARPSSAAPNVEAPAPAPTGYSSGSSNSESNNTSSDGTCNSPGSYRCDNGGEAFSVCDQGKWVSMGSTAAGMKCSGGSIVAASRFRRHLHAHKH